MTPTICAWCWTAGRLTILNGVAWESALMAIEDKSASHGMCRECEKTYREQLAKRRAS